MRTRTFRAAAVAFMAGLAVGCSTAQSDPTPPLAGTSWQATRFAGPEGTQPDDPTRYTVAFGTDGRAAIRADCNRGTGTWRSPSAGRLAFGPIATTKMGCPPGSQGDRFLTDLTDANAYSIADGRLEIATTGKAGPLVLRPVPR